MLAAADRAQRRQAQGLGRAGAGICKEWRAKYSRRSTSDAVPIRPERICHELSQHVPDDAIVVVDTGHAGMWMGGMYDLRSPRQSYMRSAGHLGWAFPAGLGAKCGAPERPVVTFTGDAGFWYHIGEIETAVRWKINAVTVVNNNGGGNQSKRGFDRVYGGTQTEQARELWTFNKMNFARIAEDMGALGIRVEHAAGFAGGARAGARRRPPGRHRRRDRHRRAGADRGGVSGGAGRRLVNHRRRGPLPTLPRKRERELTAVPCALSLAYRIPSPDAPRTRCAAPLPSRLSGAGLPSPACGGGWGGGTLTRLSQLTRLNPNDSSAPNEFRS